MIDRSFFEEDAKTVAIKVLGKTICRKMPSGEIRKMVIFETEAYPSDDSACYGYGYEGNHGNKKITAAIAPLFETGGTCCIYGGMILIVCGKIGKPDNVLIRAGIYNDNYYDGPCKVANILDMDKSFQGIDMLDTNSELWIEENTVNDYVAVKRKALRGTISEEDKNSKLRFFAV